LWTKNCFTSFKDEEETFWLDGGKRSSLMSKSNTGYWLDLANRSCQPQLADKWADNAEQFFQGLR